jgi:hypothetical protein
VGPARGPPRGGGRGGGGGGGTYCSTFHLRRFPVKYPRRNQSRFEMGKSPIKCSYVVPGPNEADQSEHSPSLWKGKDYRGSRTSDGGDAPERCEVTSPPGPLESWAPLWRRMANKNLFDRSSRTKDKGSDGGVSISWDTDCRSYAGEKEWLHW